MSISSSHSVNSPSLFVCLFPLGQQVPLGIQPSNVKITKLHLDADRRALIARKSASKAAKKVTGAEAAAAAGLDLN